MEADPEAVARAAEDHPVNDDGAVEEEEAPTPKTGMKFDNDEEVYEYYKKYGQQQGFGVIRLSRKFDEQNRLKYVTFSCSRAGDLKSSSNNSAHPRPTIKTNCKAKINVVVDKDGKFTLRKIRLEHNHDLTTSTCSKELTHAKRRRVVKKVGGLEQLPVESTRQLRLGDGDAEALRDYFVRMQNDNQDCFFVMDCESEGCLKNVFWADGRCRAAYESFGDVVRFDTACITNKYDMPLALFVGVNHHGQSVLFGCGLLSSGDADNYTWLFRTLLLCMRGVAPKAIIIDLCKAVQHAVSEVFPNARCQLCLWHIMRSFSEKFSMCGEYNSIRSALMDVVYDSLTASEFEEKWVKMVEMYNLHDLEWLKYLYDNSHRWVPVFVKDAFWAGMSTSERGQSVVPFFDGYVNSKTSLKQFVEQYDRVMRHKVAEENLAMRTSFSSTIPMITKYGIEKQFQEIYSNEIFKVFQDELLGLFYCNVMLVKEDGPRAFFRVKENIVLDDDDRRKLEVCDVVFNKIDFGVECICRLFQFKGILCRHIIAVLTDQYVKRVPQRYILDRWRKDVNRRYTSVNISYAMSEESRWYNKLQGQCKELIDIAIDSQQYKLLSTFLDEGKDKLLRNKSVCEDTVEDQAQYRES